MAKRPESTNESNDSDLFGKDEPKPVPPAPTPTQAPAPAPEASDTPHLSEETKAQMKAGAEAVKAGEKALKEAEEKAKKEMKESDDRANKERVQRDRIYQGTTTEAEAEKANKNK